MKPAVKCVAVCLRGKFMGNPLDCLRRDLQFIAHALKNRLIDEVYILAGGWWNRSRAVFDAKTMLLREGVDCNKIFTPGSAKKLILMLKSQEKEASIVTLAYEESHIADLLKANESFGYYCFSRLGDQNYLYSPRMQFLLRDRT